MNPIFYTYSEINALFNKSSATIPYSMTSFSALDHEIPQQYPIDKQDNPYAQLSLNTISSQLTSNKESLQYTPSQINSPIASPFNQFQRQNSLDSIEENLCEATDQKIGGSNIDQIDQDEYFKLSYIMRDSQQKNVLLEQKVFQLEDQLLVEHNLTQTLQQKLYYTESQLMDENYQFTREATQLKDQLQQQRNNNEKLNTQIKTLIAKQKLLYEENSKHYDDCLKANLAQQFAETQLSQLKKEYKRKMDKLQRQVENSNSQLTSQNSSSKNIQNEIFDPLDNSLNSDRIFSATQTPRSSQSKSSLIIQPKETLPEKAEVSIRKFQTPTPTPRSTQNSLNTFTLPNSPDQKSNMEKFQQRQKQTPRTVISNSSLVQNNDSPGKQSNSIFQRQIQVPKTTHITNQFTLNLKGEYHTQEQQNPDNQAYVQTPRPIYTTHSSNQLTIQIEDQPSKHSPIKNSPSKQQYNEKIKNIPLIMTSMQQ